MSMPKKNRIIQALTIVDILWIILMIAWNYSFQTVISDSYNQAQLRGGRIETRSSLFPWPVDKTGKGPFDLNAPRPLTWQESIVYIFFGNLIVGIFLIAVPIIATMCCYLICKNRRPQTKSMRMH